MQMGLFPRAPSNAKTRSVKVSVFISTCENGRGDGVAPLLA